MSAPTVAALEAQDAAALEAQDASVPESQDASAELVVSYLRAIAAGDFDHPEPSGDDPLTSAAVELVHRFRGSVREVRAEALGLASRAETLIASSSVTAHLADGVSASAVQVHEASRRVSEAVEEASGSVQALSSSVDEIASGAAKSLEVADRAESGSADAEALFGRLHAASNEISAVVKLINRIAQQTKLLALNATIEAARAGTAGVGFRVVAEEVGKLAKETTTASEEIAGLVASIQTGAEEALAEVGAVRGVLEEMVGIQRQSAAAVTQQAAATREISAQLEGAAIDGSQIRDGAQALAEAIGEVREVSHESAESANQVSARVASLDTALGVLR